MQLGQSTLFGREFSELVSPYRIHGNHVPFVLESLLVFCRILLSFKTLLYQSSYFIAILSGLSAIEFIVSPTARLSEW